MPEGAREARGPTRREKLGLLGGAARHQLAVWSDFHLRTSLSRPLLVLIEPTLRCPMACNFCDYPADPHFPKGREMTLGQWRRILEELRAYAPAAREIFVSGGEPFLRPDLCDILVHAHRVGLGTRIATIGAFCDRPTCDRLRRSPPAVLKFSIHSADPATHDRLVGRHVYDKAVGAIRYLREGGYEGKLGFLTTVYRDNVGSLGDILRLARELGVDGVFFRPLFGNTAAYRRFGDPAPLNPECVVEDAGRVAEAIAEVKDLKRRGYPVANDDRQLDLIVRQAEGTNAGLPHCHMMYESIYIRPNGDVEACGHMSLGTLGNVAEASVGEVLSSEAAYRVRHGVSRRCRCQGNAFVRKSLGEKLGMAWSLLQS